MGDKGKIIDPLPRFIWNRRAGRRILGHSKIIDEYYDQSLWTFPEVSALRDLWTSVKYQASGVKDLLDDLLQDEESSW